MLRHYGTSTLSEFLDDRVVYRSLRPVDRRLPGLEELRPALGMPDGGLPRKTEPAYAEVVAELLRRAHVVAGGDGQISGLVMVGDTLHSDGRAFLNLGAALAVPGAAFICDERTEEPHLEAVNDRGRCVVVAANRWRLLEAFDDSLAAHGLNIGPATVVVVDIDKTALGARGRNHRPIDAARIQAARGTVARLVGGTLEEGVFDQVYGILNQPRFHPFTTDNQDVVAYLCLAVAAGLYELEALAGRITSGELGSFSELLAELTARGDELPPSLAAAHRAVVEAVAAGDPTPFKEFRRAEFAETVARMGRSVDPSDLDELVHTELTITHEVRERALAWRARGALLLGLSDKPDEASLPGDEPASQGLLPLHRTPALVVGEG